MAIEFLCFYDMIPRIFVIHNWIIRNFYIHIPFCRQKCPYCKFALTPIFDASKKRRYMAHLKSEIRDSLLSSWGTVCDQREPYPRMRASDEIGATHESGADLPEKRADSSYRRNDKNNNTIYFGWGTPSVLTLEEVADILSCFEKSETTEVSFECNPEDVTSEYIEWLLNLGITRFSIWVQSLNNATLWAIHRSDRESISHALDAISDALLSFRRDPSLIRSWLWNKEDFYMSMGRDFFVPLRNDKIGISINIDFILGLPFSRPWETLENIRELHARYPHITHTSVYMLEEGNYPKWWKENSVDEEAIEKEYTEICHYFESLWWHHYEISNWAKPWYECQHNKGYWNHTDYRGFGLSSTSYADGKRWENSHSFIWYYKWERKEEEILTDEQIELEKIIFDTRTFSLDASRFEQEKIEKYREQGYMLIKNGKIILTPAWIFRENTIISELIP